MPYSLSVIIEQRPVFLPGTGIISYIVHLTYEKEGNWDWSSFDLVEEIQSLGKRLAYRTVSLDDYRTDRPVIAAGLRALMIADIVHPEVVEQIEEAIFKDMRDRDDEARERAAERRWEDRMEDA